MPQQNAAEGENIRAAIYRNAPRLLRRHVRRGSQDHSGIPRGVAPMSMDSAFMRM